MTLQAQSNNCTFSDPLLDLYEKIASDGWIICELWEDKHNLFFHPEYPNVFAELFLGRGYPEFRFFYRYPIENSFGEQIWEKLEIPDYLIGRISISDNNLALGDGEDDSDTFPITHWYTKYYLGKFSNNN